MQPIRLSSIEGRKRAVIDRVYPEIDSGAFPIKRVVDDPVTVEADIVADGHELIQATVLYRRLGKRSWSELPMKPLGNDRYAATFTVKEIGGYEYSVSAWVDHFETWRSGLEKKHAAAVDASMDLRIGAALVNDAVGRAKGKKAKRLQELAAAMVDDSSELNDRVEVALSKELDHLMKEHPDRRFAFDYPRLLRVWVDRERAAFSSWYEMFPRSTAKSPGLHGTFKDSEERLPYIAEMGFDVLYLPPIHPIGTTSRKGKDNTPNASPQDPGSPWAIGSAEGGHMAVNPALGTIEDFQRLVVAAQEHGMEVAIDIAFQCSPDHPYVHEHPEWFLKRPDGSIQFAENPPKKYEDIVPFNFECEQWRELWEELAHVVEFWIDKGVRIFRVDNPHTKPFAFWEWLIDRIRTHHPDVIFLAEAFTRPKLMQRLAKVGFTQSYTYFTWRNTKHELTEYLDYLTRTNVREYMRPNFWPNTPDILPEYIQYGGRPALVLRLALAATLSPNYGMYGPVYELGVAEALPDREEYAHSEKYEIRHWDWSPKAGLRRILTRINKARHDNPALQNPWNIRFCDIENPFILAYLRYTSDHSNVLLIVVNLDTSHRQSGWVHVPVLESGIVPGQPYLVHDLISEDKYIWNGEYNYVELDPAKLPVHIMRLHRTVRREQDFDYFM